MFCQLLKELTVWDLAYLLIHVLLNYNSNNHAFMTKKCGGRLFEPNAEWALLTAFQ